LNFALKGGDNLQSDNSTLPSHGTNSFDPTTRSANDLNQSHTPYQEVTPPCPQRPTHAYATNERRIMHHANLHENRIRQARATKSGRAERATRIPNVHRDFKKRKESGLGLSSCFLDHRYIDRLAPLQPAPRKLTVKVSDTRSDVRGGFRPGKGHVHVGPTLFKLLWVVSHAKGTTRKTNGDRRRRSRPRVWQEEELINWDRNWTRASCATTRRLKRKTVMRGGS